MTGCALKYEAMLVCWFTTQASEKSNNSALLLQHRKIFIPGYSFPLINPGWLELSVPFYALCPRACPVLLKIAELSV